MAGNRLYDVAAASALPYGLRPGPNALAVAALGAAPTALAPAVAEAEGLPGVPTGEDGRPGPSSGEVRRMQEAEDDRRARDALLSFGRTTIIPSAGDVVDGAVDAVNQFGERALAFGPQGEILGAPVEALGGAINALRAAPRAGAAAIIGERALAKPRPEQVLKGLQDEVGGLVDQGLRLGIEPGPLPDVPLSPDEQINMLTTVRDNLKSRIAGRQAELDARNANAPPTSVPATDARPPIRERAEIVDAIQSNPYVQPIPGRQGFPTKQAQTDLANQFFDQGKRLDPPGPWGRDMPETIKGVMQRASNVASGRPTANLPGLEQAAKGLAEYRKQVRDLSAQLQSARGEQIPALQVQIQDARARADRFMQLWNQARGAGENK